MDEQENQATEPQGPVYTDYIGTKRVRATPLLRGQYYHFRQRPVPHDENPFDDGFLIEYPGGRQNLPSHAGYVYWQQKDVFESAYRPSFGLSFGLALEAMKRAESVIGGQVALPLSINKIGELVLTCSDGSTMNYTPTSAEMLAENWQIVPKVEAPDVPADPDATQGD